MDNSNKMKLTIEGTPDQIAEVLRKMGQQDPQPTVLPMPYPVYPSQPIQPHWPGYPNPYIEWVITYGQDSARTVVL